MRISSLLYTVLMTCICFCLGSCSLLKAGPAEDAGFIEQPTQMKRWNRASFLHRIWFKDQEQLYANRHKYTKIRFRPVRTEFLLKKGWWDNLNEADRAHYDRDVAEMALFIQERFDRVFLEDPKKRFEVVQEEDESTLVYEIALVELVATKVHVNTLGTALGAVVPGGGIVKAFASGSIAVEVKAFDGGNQELLLTWADREKDRIAPVSLNEYSWYGGARDAVDSWAHALLEVYHTPATVTIEDSLPVTLMPY